MSGSQNSFSLGRSLSESLSRRIWLVFIVACLAVMWCALDSWNHEMGAQLFQMSEVKGFTVDRSGTLRGVLEPFKYTLTLAFLQFAFAGFVFCSMFAGKSICAGESVSQGLAHFWPTVPDARWPALVSTHIFGSLLLQSLMMPTQMMSLGFFAATRAVEVPIAAGVRAKVFGASCEGPSLRTTMLMFAAAWLLFFSYSQIAECLCVWSGFGVALSGVALYFVYALLLTIPATNVVLQESVMVQLQVSPILVQGIQNLGAAALFVPILLAAHMLGYEDVRHAAAMITGHREVYMMVLWLCVQTVVISAVTVGLILTMDSFWAVAARSLRVVFWWARQLQLFYVTSSMLLSVARPHASLWSFVMLCGIVLGLAALVTDSRQTEDPNEDKALLIPSESSLEAKGLGMGKYV